jgi:hypothetical protein
MVGQEGEERFMEEVLYYVINHVVVITIATVVVAIVYVDVACVVYVVEVYIHVVHDLDRRCKLGEEQ